MLLARYARCAAIMLLARYARSAAITNKKLSTSLNGTLSDFEKLGVAYKIQGAQDFMCNLPLFRLTQV